MKTADPYQDCPPKPGALERQYPILVFFSKDDACFVAKSSSWPFLAAFGDTEIEAVKEIVDAITGAMECAKELGKPIPPSDPILDALVRYKPILNISKVARLSNMNLNTLRSKLDRRTPFKPEESLRIRKTMEDLGILIEG